MSQWFGHTGILLSPQLPGTRSVDSTSSAGRGPGSVPLPGYWDGAREAPRRKLRTQLVPSARRGSNRAAHRPRRVKSRPRRKHRLAAGADAGRCDHSCIAITGRERGLPCGRSRVRSRARATSGRYRPLRTSATPRRRRSRRVEPGLSNLVRTGSAEVQRGASASIAASACSRRSDQQAQQLDSYRSGGKRGVSLPPRAHASPIAQIRSQLKVCQDFRRPDR